MNQFNWKDWYSKARVKEPYILQEKELMEIIKKECVIIGDVLDVGCGDGRFAKHFYQWQYWGIDKNYNEFDLLNEEDWNSIDSKFDLCFTSLVLMLFNEVAAKQIFQKMLNLGKIVLLYEENIEDREGNYVEGKYFHDYANWDKLKLIKKGISTINPAWKWYLFKGNQK